MGLKAIKDLLVGTLVGIVSMLPGASGATIAVIFGIYERLISDLAEIRRRLLHDLKFIIPVGIGILLGLVLCSFGLKGLLDRWEIPMMFFFAALIFAQIPDIMDLSKDDRPMTKYNWIALACGFAVMMGVMYLGMQSEVERSVDSAIIWIVVGMILAVSKLAPGVSGSTILLAMGLFTPFMNAITDFDMSVLIPGALGLLIGALAFSKLISHFLTNNRKSTYIAILGLTIGSVVAVFIDACAGIDGTTMVLQSIVGVIAGLVLGLALSKVSKRYALETIEEEVGA